MEKIKLGEIQDDPRYTKKQREELRKRLDKLNDELKVRQESIDLLKSRLRNQIMSFKETIAKVLDKDTSLGKKDQNSVQRARNYYCFYTHGYQNGHRGTC